MKERVLDAAQVLVQQRGFNAFSFRDLTEPLGITNAGIHYHFPTKAELGRALVSRYRASFMDALARVEAERQSAIDQLNGFAQIYADTLKSSRFCLCGMLASDALTLPKEVYGEVQKFFENTEAWLAAVLERGLADEELMFEESAASMATLVLATVEGGLLTAWPLQASDPEKAGAHFQLIIDRLITTIKAR